MFGVNADLSPLLVAFVGLLCGSTVGAACGFAVGLLSTCALLQTLGLTSLIFTLDRLLVAGACASCATRRRRSRRCSSARRPPRSSLVGYSLMEFMLGVDAPVSFELLRQIVLIAVVVNSIIALPLWALVRALAAGRAARGSAPAPPPSPRVHDRRAQPALAPMSAIEPAGGREPRMPGLAAAGAARGDHRRRRDGDVRGDLLPPVVPAGPLRRTVRPAGRRQPRARPADPRSARADPRPRRPGARRKPCHQRRADRALGAAPRRCSAASTCTAGSGGCWG